MKNRPRALKTAIRHFAIDAAKELYRKPKYKVSIHDDTIFVERLFKDNTEGLVLILTIY